MSDKTNVLYLCPNGYLGGAERAVIDICRGHLQRNQINIHLLFFSEGVAADLARSYNINVSILPRKLKLSHPLKLLNACLYIRSYIKKNHINYIHSTMPYAQIVSFFSSIFLRKIVRVWFQHGPVGGLLDHLAAKTPVEQIYFNSTFLQNEHNKMYQENPPTHKQMIVPYAVNCEEVSLNDVEEIKSKYKKENNIFIVTAGRICSWKGYEILINAIKILDDKKVNVLVIGSALREEDKKYETDLKEIVSNLNLSEQIQFIPFQKNIQTYMKAADYFIHSSTTPEPFGLVVAESMLQETLVIGSSQGGIRDILINGETGLNYDTTAPNADIQLANIFKDLIDQTIPHSQQQKMAAKAREGILRNHSFINTAKIIEDNYVQLKSHL